MNRLKIIPELQRAMKGSMGEHQMQMLKFQLNHIDFLTRSIEKMDLEIKKTEKIAEYIKLLDEIPGIGVRSAERIKNRNIKSLENLGFCVQLT